MSNAKIIVFYHHVFNHDNNQLLVSGLRRSTLDSPSIEQPLLDHLRQAGMGDRLTVIMPKALNQPPANHSADLVMPRILFNNAANLQQHSVVKWKGGDNIQHIGRVTAISGPWLTIQLFPAWLWNKNLRNEVQVLEIRDPTAQDPASPFNRFELAAPPAPE